MMGRYALCAYGPAGYWDTNGGLVATIVTGQNFVVMPSQLHLRRTIGTPTVPHRCGKQRFVKRTGAP